MATISVSLPTDGTTADVADYNTPITTIVNEINGNLDNANIKSAAAIAFSKISGGSDAALTAWTSFTPTWTATGGTPVIGNGTLTGAYVQVGKFVTFRINLVLGSTSSISGMTDWVFGLPATASSSHTAGTPIGNVYILDNGTAEFMGQIRLFSTTTMVPYVGNAAGTYVTIGTTLSHNVPMGWTNGDAMRMQGVYEAA